MSSTPTTRAAAALCAVAALLVLCVSPADACVGTPVVLSGNFKTAKPSDPEYAFDKSGMQQVFNHMSPIKDFRANNASSFSCVDSRGEEGQLVRGGGECVYASLHPKP